ncbi:hypothetical protein LJC56_00765 [Christensenellaceae bacterium OttesenSCG-928-K19]|nr:hypothetical protein [Christensenellaceae bacterium OttesenSCG-928-K19]
MKLQPREKTLLAILIIVAAILLPSFFIIRPLAAENTAKQAELAVFEESYASLEPGYEEMIAAPENQGEPAVPSKIKAYDIHYMLEDAYNSADVLLDSLQISDYEPVGSSDRITIAGLEDVAVIIQKCSVSASVTGGFDQIMDVVDSLSGNLFIVLTELNIDHSSTNEAGNGTIGLDIYAILHPNDPEYAGHAGSIDME